MSTKLLLACLAFSLPALAADKKIERMFASKCGACHGKDGKAQTEKGKQMEMRDIASADFQKLTDDEMRKGINEGVKTPKGTMEGFKDDLKPADVDGLIAHMRGMKK